MTRNRLRRFGKLGCGGNGGSGFRDVGSSSSEVGSGTRWEGGCARMTDLHACSSGDRVDIGHTLGKAERVDVYGSTIQLM